MKNGKLLNICNYIDDKLNGGYKTYYFDGQIKEEVNYINDKKEG